MISAGDFRKGITFEMDGDVYQVVDFQHVKPGKGAAFVRTKIRSVLTGVTKDVTFNPTEKYPKLKMLLLTLQKNIRKLILKLRKCSTYIVMEHYIILWILKPLNNYL